MKSLDNWSDLPPDFPYGSNWGHKIADFGFLPYISILQKYKAQRYEVTFKRYLVYRG